MSTIVITVNVSQLDPEDQKAIRHVCDQENKRRAGASVEQLDFSTPQLRKAYYESLLVTTATDIHKRYIQQADRETDKQKSFQDMRAAWANATPEQRAAALKAMSAGVTG